MVLGDGAPCRPKLWRRVSVSPCLLVRRYRHPSLPVLCAMTITQSSFFVGVVVFLTLHRPFYPALSVHAVSLLIPYPREIRILWSQTVRQEKAENVKKVSTSSVKQMKCQRTGYENTTTHARPGNTNKNATKPHKVWN